MQLIGIVLLYLVGLSGSEGIIGKKCAWLLLLVYDYEVGIANGKAEPKLRSVVWKT